MSTKQKLSTEFAGCIKLQKELKLFNFQSIKSTRSVLEYMLVFDDNWTKKFENRKMKVGKSKMWKVRVGLIAAKWHLQSFVLMKLGGKPKKESQTKHILGTWCRYLKHKTILIFEYPSIPVWGYECPTKRNLSFIEYFPKSNNRLELSMFSRSRR